MAKLSKYKEISADKEDLTKSKEAKEIMALIIGLNKEFDVNLKAHNKADKKLWTIDEKESVKLTPSELKELKELSKNHLELAIKIRNSINDLKSKYKKLTGRYTYEVNSKLIVEKAEMKLSKFVEESSTPPKKKKEMAFSKLPVDKIERALRMAHIFSKIDSNHIDESSVEFNCIPKTKEIEISDLILRPCVIYAQKGNYNFSIHYEPKLVRMIFTEKSFN